MNPGDLQMLCRIVVDRSPLALAVTVGESHRVHCVNPVFCELAGVAPTALLEHAFAEAFADSRTNGSLGLLDRVWRTSESERMTEIGQQLPGGGHAIWSYAVWPVPAERYPPLALIVQISDDTERLRRRQAQADTAGEMRQAAERLLIAGVEEQKVAEAAEQRSSEMDALLKSMSEGIAVVDAERRIVLMNAAGRQIFHLPSEEEVWAPMEQGHARLEQLDGTPIPFHAWPISRALQGEHFDQNEVTVVHPDDSRRRVVFSGNALRDEVGEISLAIVVFRDVTELRETEAMKDQLLSLISHDLRSPLNAILGHADLLRIGLAQEGREKETRFADAIIHGVKRMESMIVELVESARLESAGPRHHKHPCDLSSLIASAVENVVSLEDRARIEVVVPETLPAVSADPERIDRVLMNLLGNALKYSAADAPVTIRLEQRGGGEVVVSITDRGVGISGEDLPHVFDRFYRGESGAKAAGFGLGLYITRLIIDAHGGRVWAESEPGKGSTFAFALPIE